MTEEATIHLRASVIMLKLFFCYYDDKTRCRLLFTYMLLSNDARKSVHDFAGDFIIQFDGLMRNSCPEEDTRSPSCWKSRDC